MHLDDGEEEDRSTPGNQGNKISTGGSTSIYTTRFFGPDEDTLRYLNAIRERHRKDEDKDDGSNSSKSSTDLEDVSLDDHDDDSTEVTQNTPSAVETADDETYSESVFAYSLDGFSEVAPSLATDTDKRDSVETADSPGDEKVEKHLDNKLQAISDYLDDETTVGDVASSSSVAEKAEESSITVVEQAEESSSSAVEQAEESSSCVVEKAEESSSSVVEQAEESSSSVAEQAEESSSSVVVQAEESSSSVVEQAEESETANHAVDSANNDLETKEQKESTKRPMQNGESTNNINYLDFISSFDEDDLMSLG
jgi:vacuolar-type H+-ATPase subunit H